MWGSLKHNFVLPFLGIHEFHEGKESQFFLVSPYMTNGTLAQWRKKVNPSISEMENRVWPFYLSLSIDAHSLLEDFGSCSGNRIHSFRRRGPRRPPRGIVLESN